MSMSDFQNTAPTFWHTATVADPESSSVLYLPLDTCLPQLDTLASTCAAVGPPPPPLLPVVTTIRSKSGAQPVVLKSFRVLLPALSVTVTFKVPTVVKLPVAAKLSVVAPPPLTLRDAVRALPLAYLIATVALPAAADETPVNVRVPALFPTNPTFFPLEQGVQVAIRAPPARTLPEASASY